MARIMKLEFFLSILVSLIVSSSSKSCSSYKFTTKQTFRNCIDLPYLDSFLHWNYNSSSGIMQIAYRQTDMISPTSWVAWGINLNGTGMVGSQTLIAFQYSNGSAEIFTSQLDSHTTTMPKGKLKFRVSNLTASFSDVEIIIFATLALSRNLTTVNHAWQNGPVEDITGSPYVHSFAPAHRQSFGTINLIDDSGRNDTMTEPNGRDEWLRKANTHGVLCGLGWGVMMPLGAMISRYLKIFNPEGKASFYMHLTCQFTAYILGMIGMAMGLKLGEESPGTQDAHKKIGIILLIFGSLQEFTLVARPGPEHKYRMYWTIYHVSMGYTVILLSIINVIKGFEILKADTKWKDAYKTLMALSVMSACLLEARLWSDTRREGNENRQIMLEKNRTHAVRPCLIQP